MRNLYKNFLAAFVVVLVSMTAAFPVYAQEEISVNKNEAVIVVSGIVCSFCAQGLTKKLSKLSFIDTSKYTDGVMVDIENQKVTIAVKGGDSIDFDEVFFAIKSGGYEPVNAYTFDGEIITPEEG